jgi:transcription initiation factor TFIIE subunit alpha
MQNLIEMIEDYIKKKFGDDSLKVFRAIGAKENVSEFKIAEDLRMNINYVRNLLYKFYSNHLVYATRKKDRQKGWYIYYWTFNFKHAKDLIVISKQKSLEKLKKINRNEVEDLYSCPNGCIKFKIIDAMEHHFKCPECESILVKKDVKEDGVKVNEDLLLLEKDLELLNKPVDIQSIKEETKKKEKKLRKKKPDKTSETKKWKKYEKIVKKPKKPIKPKVFKQNENKGYKGYREYKNYKDYKDKKKAIIKKIQKKSEKKLIIKKPTKPIKLIKPDKLIKPVKKSKKEKIDIKDEKKGFLQKLKRIRF